MVDLSTLDERDISSLSDTQDKVLALLPIVPALLSFLGSASIIYMVLSNPKRTPYRRILCGFSCFDCPSSLVYPLQSFLLPAETSQRVWAAGNDATCTALGFFMQLFFATMFYNGMLSFYFLLVVRFGVREEVLARRYEPWMHGLAIGWPLVTALVGLGMGLYHEFDVANGCWITEYPEGCDHVGSVVECQSATIAWIVSGGWAFFFMLAIFINNTIIYFHVRNTIQRGRQRSSSTMGASSLRKSQAQEMPWTAISAANFKDFSTHFTTRTSTNTNTNTSTHFNTRASTNASSDSQLKRIVAVRTQGLLYVGAYSISFIPTMCLRVMESQDFTGSDEAKLFPFLVLQAIFWPSQGFFNFFIFVRPSYVRIRQTHTEESRGWALRRAVFGEEKVPKTSRSNTRQSSNGGGVNTSRDDNEQKEEEVAKDKETACHASTSPRVSFSVNLPFDCDGNQESAVAPSDQ